MAKRFAGLWDSLFETVGDLTRKSTAMNKKNITENFAKLSGNEGLTSPDKGGKELAGSGDSLIWRER
ncbi:MAG: hypothetical protein M0P70_18530 [Desulfobulbaceae bacterium]|nr:hypothetical protein [Desulfobulbaceae bacterium]